MEGTISIKFLKQKSQLQELPKDLNNESGGRHRPHVAEEGGSEAIDHESTVRILDFLARMWVKFEEFKAEQWLNKA